VLHIVLTAHTCMAGMRLADTPVTFDFTECNGYNVFSAI